MGHDRDPSSRRKTPILLRRSLLSEDLRVYAVFDYNVKRDNAVVARSGGKEDVTQDFLRCAAEQWPHLVEEGYIQKAHQRGEE